MTIATRAGSYLDTSFLFKLYLPEPESDAAIEWLGEHKDSVYISGLSDVELTSSFARGDSLIVALRAMDAYREDCVRGVYERLAMDAEVFSRAQLMAETYARDFRLRSLDILHLAVAVGSGIRSFATYDRRLAIAATAIGLTVYPSGY